MSTQETVCKRTKKMGSSQQELELLEIFLYFIVRNPDSSGLDSTSMLLARTYYAKSKQ